MQISDFNLPQSIIDSYKDIIEMVIASKSIDTFEQKKYWLDALQKMVPEHIERLRWILVEEIEETKKANKEQAEEIEKAKLKAESALRQKNLDLKKQAIRMSEAKSEAEEQQYQESLLKSLNNL